MIYSNKEIRLIEGCLKLEYTHQDIVDCIFKDLGIVRTVKGIKSKCFKLDLRSLNSKKKTTEQFINEMKVIDSNILILDEYVDNKTKITCKCLIDGHEWEATPNGLLRGHGCPLCGGTTLKTHEQFIEEMKFINSNIFILGNYINNKTKIKVKCLIDGHIWETTPNSLLRGTTCLECSKRSNGGAYQNMTKEQLDALPYPLYLYKVKLQFEDEIFYKFGLTMHEDRSRYKNYKPYKVIEELSFEELDAWAAKCKEKELISNYEPIHHFGGWTECYKLEKDY